MNVRLDIARLVLDGLDLGAHDHVPLQAAAEAELTRLLAERGVSPDLAHGIAVPALRGTDIAIAPGATPADIGTAIARSVAGGVARQGGGR